ncbi:MAG: integrase core domain-containing protein [Candidatus Chromulinivorax sp.]
MTTRKREVFRTVTANEYTEKAYKRLALIEKYDRLIQTKCPQSIVLETLGVSERSIYRWKNRFKSDGLDGLEDESRCPKTSRKPQWTSEMKNKVLKKRKEFSFFGKAKIAVMYEREHQEKISESTTGRILKQLLDERKIQLVDDVCGKKITKSRILNDHAKRLPRGKKSRQAGELIQIDHMSIHVAGLGARKQFNAICPITKFVVQKNYKQATSHAAEDFLKIVIEKMPFTILSIQVDGGSEFMSVFEQACGKKAIPLFVLPPYSPQLNGGIERCNGTFKYEFFKMNKGFKSQSELENKLDKFTDFYNNIRLHQNLGLLTPCQFIEKLI